MTDTTYDVLIAAIEDALPPHPDLANLKGDIEIIRESERDRIRAKLMAYAERLRCATTPEPPLLRESFVAELYRMNSRIICYVNWTLYVRETLTAALSVVLPDDTEQPGFVSDYDYSHIQRQVERRAIKARFLDLIDSLATDGD